MLHELGDVFTKQRKRRIGYHDVCLLQALDAFQTSEITVSAINSAC